jgi:hypothetical protein
MPLTLMLVACDGGKTEGDTAGLGEITDDTGGGGGGADDGGDVDDTGPGGDDTGGASDDTGSGSDGSGDDTGSGGDDTGSGGDDTGSGGDDTGAGGDDTGGDTGPVDTDGDGYSAEEDCDDSDASVNPGAEEVAYDGVDNDCDEATADDDLDGDGYGYEEDCDDDDADLSPDAEEVCDGVDNNCDGVTDTDAVDADTWYYDGDTDGYGVDLKTRQACEQPEGYAEYSGDCDDADAAYNPGAVEDDCADPNDYNCDGTVGYEDGDGDGYAACEECNDGDAAINPDAEEVCDDVDNDCDGDVDGGASDASTWYYDGDVDGYGDPEVAQLDCDAPFGYTDNDLDCDDSDGDISPEEDEVCDGVDNNCDGVVDTDAVDQDTWYADADEDGFGDPDSGVEGCEQPDGYTADSQDCDDTDLTINPDADEVCDGVDNNCDGGVDDDAVDRDTWYADDDGDGFGDPESSTAACEQPEGYTADSQDCDDGDEDIHPAAEELCDGVDNNCDGEIDEDTAADASTWYADADEDGFGDADNAATACEAGDGYVADASDCDDSDAAINPDGEETCDGVDEDCDSLVDEDAADAATFYADSDEDGYGDPDVTLEACDPPDGYTTDSADCDDSLSAVYPGAEEICNALDDDCDADVDEEASDASAWYADSDEDGFGDSETTTTACDAPEGYIADASDCDDDAASTYPGAQELCDGVDSDCDAQVDEDAADASAFYADGDGDGYGDPDDTTAACDAPEGYTADSTDCDDDIAAIYPGAEEICNSLDDDCDTTIDEDATDAVTFYADGDSDGYGDPDSAAEACEATGGYAANDDDCDDSSAAINPGADEICDDIDNNCDGVVDTDAVDLTTYFADSDEDGFGDAESTEQACDAPEGYTDDSTDCNDADPDTWPGAPELCDGLDSDCSGELSWLELDDDGDGLRACEAAVWFRSDGETNNDPSGGSYGSTTAAGLLTDAGFTWYSDRLANTEISDSWLYDVGVMVMVGRGTDGPLSSDEAAALADWVADGGSLLYSGYHPYQDGCDMIDSLPSDFGLGCDNIDDSWGGSATNVVEHPVTDGVSEVVGAGGELWTVADPSQVLVDNGEWPAVTAAEIGDGRLVGVSDEWFMYDAGVGSSDISQGDNYTLVENIWAWLGELAL